MAVSGKLVGERRRELANFHSDCSLHVVICNSAISLRLAGNLDKSRKFGLYSTQREVGVGRERNSTKIEDHDRELELGL